jgi:hypothetical protein
MKNTKQTYIVLTLIILFAVVVSGLITLNRNNNKSLRPKDSFIDKINLDTKQQNITPETSSTTDTTKQNPKDETFTSKARQEFIDACVSKNQPPATCSCTADYIHNNYSPSEILSMYYEFKKSEQIPSEVKKALDLCKK